MQPRVDGYAPRAPTPAASRAQRERQLSELCTSVSGTRPLNGEASLLETPVGTKDGGALALRIALPLGFPAAPPELTVTAPVQHPWVDPATRRVDYSSARPWREGSSLAALVADVRASLAAQGVSLAPRGTAAAPPSPPSHAPRDDPSVATLLRNLSLDAGGAAGGAGGAADALRARLDALPASALRNLLVDDEAFAALLADAASASEAAALVEQLRASVVDAAQRNLRLAVEAADLRSQCAIVRATDFAPAKAAYDEAVARQAALLQRCAPAQLLAALAASAAEDDAASEALEAQLLAGELPADAFLKQFRPLRRRYHMRELKRAASAHLL